MREPRHTEVKYIVQGFSSGRARQPGFNTEVVTTTSWCLSIHVILLSAIPLGKNGRAGIWPEEMSQRLCLDNSSEVGVQQD